jgi:hypothetical protein
LNAPSQNQPTEKTRKFANASQKLKEVQATAQIQHYCTTFNFAQPHPSTPATQNLFFISKNEILNTNP